MKKLFGFIILLPIAVVLITLSIANRQNVKLILDPFASQETALSISLPFFVYLFAALIVGFIMGGCVSWIKNGKWRKAAKQNNKEAQKWQRKANILEAKPITTPAQSNI